MMTRDLQLAYRARREMRRMGVDTNYSLRIILEARRAGVPLSWAFALVEQESAFKNITGCDRGASHCNAPVTKKIVAETLAHNPSNGIGLTQITNKDLIREANHLGGAEKPKYQLRVGLKYFKEVAGRNYKEAWRYNGSMAYQSQIEAKQKRWHKVLTGK